MQVKLTKDAIEILERAYIALSRSPGKPERALGSMAAFVLTKLLEQWDALQPDSGGDGEPVSSKLSPRELSDALRGITEPDVSLDVSVRRDSSTPRATDGLVPWDYVVVGYSSLPFVALAAKDYTDVGEKRCAVIRNVLTRIPEDQWESEQTKSIMEKALQGVTP